MTKSIRPEVYEAILAVLRDERIMTVRQIADKFDRSLDYTRMIVTELAEQGSIERIGKQRPYHYRVVRSDA